MKVGILQMSLAGVMTKRLVTVEVDDPLGFGAAGIVSWRAGRTEITDMP
jgi:hypothetical protein